jgi:dihydroxyacetone kinase phosphoprotein-dependent L subunit
MPALIFDCDGVLADTERDGHLPAFNETFAEFGVPVHWSDADYAEKVKIGGGKERMRSILTPQLARELGLPEDPAAWDETILAWHRRKTALYTERVAGGVLPARPGILRLAADAAAAGWTLAVASTSAEPSVRAVLEHAVGPELATRFSVFAGDIVPAKKPAPDIYLHALRELGLDPADALVIEDSENGLRAALAAGLKTLVTVSSYTAGEDFDGAALVVSSLGDPDGPAAETLSDPAGIRPGSYLTLADLARMLAPVSPNGAAPNAAESTTASSTRETETPMSGLADTEFVVRSIAQTAVDNEKEFGDLDAVVGDGDFGYSLARGFEIVLADWDSFDRASPSAFLQKVGMVISGRIGGTSGPLWGTAFLRASIAVKGRDGVSGSDAVAMLRSAIDGIKARGNSDVGDKTLLDALVPVTDALEEEVASGTDAPTTLHRLALVARQSSDRTSMMQARRGRASYTGERSIGSPDPGAVAVAVILERLSAEWDARVAASAEGGDPGSARASSHTD